VGGKVKGERKNPERKGGNWEEPLKEKQKSWGGVAWVKKKIRGEGTREGGARHRKLRKGKQKGGRKKTALEATRSVLIPLPAQKHLVRRWEKKRKKGG